MPRGAGRPFLVLTQTKLPFLGMGRRILDIHTVAHSRDTETPRNQRSLAAAVVTGPNAPRVRQYKAPPGRDRGRLMEKWRI